MSKFMGLRCSVLVLLLAGCGNESSSEAPSAVETPVSEDPVPDESEPEVGASESETPTGVRETPRRERLPPAVLRQIRAAVREGRRATRRGDIEAARGHFDRALELNPNDAGIHCEAGFAALESRGSGGRRYARRRLGLGVALFGQNPPVPLRVPLAMCLYNRGLLAEREREWSDAVRFFERSLALRPNAVVQRRRAAAGEHTPRPPRTEVASSLEELCSRWDERDVEGEAEDVDGVLGCDVDRTFPGEGDRPEVGAITQIEETRRDWGIDGIWTLAVRVPRGYHIVTVYSGMVNANWMSSLEWAVESVATPAPGWLRVDYVATLLTGMMDNIESDGDEYACVYTREQSSHSTYAVLCRLADMRCGQLPSANTMSWEGSLECEGERPADWDEVEMEPGEESYEVEIRIDATRGVRAHLSEGELPEDYPLPVDRWTALDDTLALAEPLR